ncbi:MAG: C39 family peptidase [Caldilineales bacterium]|nr:C39 family peptidase [Caldilineales bacterium]
MKRLLVAALGLGAVLVLLLFVVGSLRYGSTDGLIRRVRAEVAARRPPDHPLFVPTPLPTPTPTAAPSATATIRLPSATVPTIPTATPPPTGTLPPRLSATPSPTETLPPSPTATPTDTPIPTATLAPTATPAPVASAEVVRLTGIRHAWQTWNNCGPATLAMHLSYFGSALTQEDVRRALRHHPDDKNVNPEELAAFAVAQGLQARVRVNGSHERLQAFVAAGLPVLIETWLEPEPNDGMGHYRLLVGYDEARQEWIVYDSYVATGIRRDAAYEGIRLSYADVARDWRVFNRTYLVLYTPAQAETVLALLGEDADETRMWERSLAQAQAEIAAVGDAFAWFNLGTSLTALGRYEEAAAAYDHARQLGLPWRMLWYQFGPFRAYAESGRWEEVVALARATLRTTDTVEELHYWHGRGLEALGDTAAAQAAYRRALEINPMFAPLR